MKRQCGGSAASLAPVVKLQHDGLGQKSGDAKEGSIKRGGSRGADQVGLGNTDFRSGVGMQAEHYHVLCRDYVISPHLASQLKGVKLFADYSKADRHWIIQSPIVPYLIRFLSRDDSIELQCESCIILINLAAGNDEYRPRLKAAGLLPPLLRIIRTSMDERLFEAAIWCLANMFPVSQDAIRENSSWMIDRILAWTLQMHTRPEFPLTLVWCLNVFSIDSVPSPFLIDRLIHFFLYRYAAEEAILEQTMELLKGIVISGHVICDETLFVYLIRFLQYPSRRVHSLSLMNAMLSYSTANFYGTALVHFGLLPALRGIFTDEPKYVGLILARALRCLEARIVYPVLALGFLPIFFEEEHHGAHCIAHSKDFEEEEHHGAHCIARILLHSKDFAPFERYAGKLAALIGATQNTTVLIELLRGIRPFRHRFDLSNLRTHPNEEVRFLVG